MRDRDDGHVPKALMQRRALALSLTAAILFVSSRTRAEPAANKDPADAPWFGRTTAVAAVGTIYALTGTWMYFSWFRDRMWREFHYSYAWESESPFAPRAYAGGADKWGHMWAGYVLSRGTSELLRRGGWGRLRSSLLAGGLASVAFTLQEYKDGHITGFEIGDLVADVAGAALAIAMTNVPALDQLLDFRLEYIPSNEADRIDLAQDYTGQTYAVALHLDALPYSASSQYLLWTQYVDLNVGFQARHYLPVDDSRRTQSWYAGISLDVQELLEVTLSPSKGRSIGSGVLEVLSVPYTTFRFTEVQRVRKTPPPP